MCRLTARLTEAGIPEDNTINNPHLPDEYIAPKNQDHVGNMLELLKILNGPGSFSKTPMELVLDPEAT